MRCFAVSAGNRIGFEIQPGGFGTKPVEGVQRRCLKLLLCCVRYGVVRRKLARRHFKAAAETGGEVLAGIEPIAKGNVRD